MPIDTTKLDSFKSAAVAQGFDQATIDAFVSAKESKSLQFDTNLGKYQTAVSQGMPISSVPKEYQVDVYSGLSMKEPSFGSADGLSTGNRIFTTQKDRDDYMDDLRDVESFKKGGLKWDDLSNQAIGIATEQGLKPSAVDKGKQLPAGNLAKLGEIKNSINQISGLQESFDESKDVFGPVEGSLRGLNPLDTEAQKAKSTIFLVRQIIGKGLEGGVLRKEDEYKYKEILPKLSDTPETVQNKINLLNDVLQEKYDNDIRTYQQGGYDPFYGLESGVYPEGSTQRDAGYTDVNKSIITSPELGLSEEQSQGEIKSILGDGFIGKVGDFFVGRTIDFINTVKNTPKLIDATKKAGEKNTELYKRSQEFIEKARLETDPKRKKDLLEQSKKVMNEADMISGVLTKAIDSYMETSGISEKETERSNFEFAAKRGVGVAGEIGAWIAPAVKGIKGVGLASRAGQGALSGGLYGLTGEESESIQESLTKGATQAATGAVIGAATSKQGLKAIDKLTDLMPGKRLVKSSVKSISKIGKNLLFGNEEAATNELFQLTKNTTLVRRLKEKGIDPSKDFQRLIPEIAGETYDDMYRNAGNALKPRGEKLNNALRKSNLDIDMTSIQDEILEAVEKLSQGSKSDQRIADNLLDEATTFFKTNPKQSPIYANQTKTMFDTQLFSTTGAKKNITPFSQAATQFKEIYTSNIRKQLRTDKTVKGLLKDYELMKAAQKALEKPAGIVEGLIPKETVGGVIGAAYKTLTSGARDPKYLGEIITEPTFGKGVRKAGTAFKGVAEKVAPAIRTGLTLNSGGGNGMSMNNSTGMTIDNSLVKNKHLYK